MSPRLSFIPLWILLAGSVRAELAPSDWVQPPLTVVSQTVNVSVGERMTLVVGQYWLQYVPKYDDPGLNLVSVYYPVFVPKGLSSFAELLDLTQVKLMLGEQEYRPAEARVLEDHEVGAIQALPENAAVAWFVFKLPRNLARWRFEVLISHFQPQFQGEGRTVSAVVPWLPNLESLRQEMELKDSDFVITVEALPGVQFEPISHQARVELATPTRYVVHPAHAQTIAVALLPPATEKKKDGQP